MTINDERKEKAEALKRKLNISSDEDKKEFSTEHPSVEIAKQLKNIMELLADDNKEIFSRLDKGYKNPFVGDETIIYAEAISFSQNPLPNLQKRLEDLGIKRKVLSIKKIDNIEIEHESFEAVTFEVTPIIEYAREVLRKRQITNGIRVEQFTKLADALTPKNNSSIGIGNGGGTLGNLPERRRII